jgi:hypothetical protein
MRWRPFSNGWSRISHNPYPTLRAPAEPAATRVFVRGVRLVDVHHHGPLEVRHGLQGVSVCECPLMPPFVGPYLRFVRAPQFDLSPVATTGCDVSFRSTSIGSRNIVGGRLPRTQNRRVARHPGFEDLELN